MGSGSSTALATEPVAAGADGPTAAAPAAAALAEGFVTVLALWHAGQRPGTGTGREKKSRES